MSTAAKATPAMMAAAYQCDSEPKSSPMGLTDRDAETRPTPATRTTAPTTSVSLTAWRDKGTASTSAQTR